MREVRKEMFRVPCLINIPNSVVANVRTRTLQVPEHNQYKMASRVWTEGVLVTVFAVICLVVTANDPVETNHDFVKAERLLNFCVNLFAKAREILSCGRTGTSEQPRSPQQPWTSGNQWTTDPPTTYHPDVPPPQPSRLPRDCFELMSNGTKTSGVYRILPEHRMFYGTDGFDVYCDMDTDGGGWTVIQRRGDYGTPKDYFYRNWESYKTGFGDITRDFWLGNDKIHSLTNQKLYSIRFDLKDWEGETRWAVYRKFWISGEMSNYTLYVFWYNGTAGNSFYPVHHSMKFSTFDRDNDMYIGNCAEIYQGAWWYNKCHHSNLNGLYLKGNHNKTGKSVSWYDWKDDDYSLFETKMKIRPVNVSSNTTVPL